jgi:hypothetical protein
MSGPPPGPGPARSMSVGTGPPSAGMPQHSSMPQQQGQVPPPAGAHQGPQSQQNLNQIVRESGFFSLTSFTARAACALRRLPFLYLYAAGFRNLRPVQPPLFLSDSVVRSSRWTTGTSPCVIRATGVLGMTPLRPICTTCHQRPGLSWRGE